MKIFYKFCYMQPFEYGEDPVLLEDADFSIPG